MYHNMNRNQLVHVFMEVDKTDLRISIRIRFAEVPLYLIGVHRGLEMVVVQDRVDVKVVPLDCYFGGDCPTFSLSKFALDADADPNIKEAPAFKRWLVRQYGPWRKPLPPPHFFASNKDRVQRMFDENRAGDI